MKEMTTRQVKILIVKIILLLDGEYNNIHWI